MKKQFRTLDEKKNNNKRNIFELAQTRSNCRRKGVFLSKTVFHLKNKPHFSNSFFVLSPTVCLQVQKKEKRFINNT